MSFRVLLNTSLALATGNLWVWVFNMTFNKSPRNTAVDNYVINTSRGFRWRLICSFDPLLGSWESLVPLTRSLQIFKAERALQVPAHVCLHLRLHLYTCMCYTRTHTHEHMHTHTYFGITRCPLSQTPSWFWHLEPQERCVLEWLGNPWEWCLVWWQGVHRPGWSCSRSLRHRVVNTLLPTDYMNVNLDRIVLGSPSVG